MIRIKSLKRFSQRGGERKTRIASGLLPDGKLETDPLKNIYIKIFIPLHKTFLYAKQLDSQGRRFEAQEKIKEFGF